MANVKVAVRVRPLSKKEEDCNATNIVEVKGDNGLSIKNIKVDSPESVGDKFRERVKYFNFDHCYYSVDKTQPNYASQELIFQDLGTEVLNSSFDGYNVSLFAYGQTGSGKTYTMMGNPDELGVIPRICDGLCSRVDDFEDGVTFKIEVSYLEIYNERVRDLLAAPDDVKYTLKVREHPKEGPYVQDLSRHFVTDYAMVTMLLNKGNINRTTAATHMHDASSRSHAIFTLNFIQAKLENGMPSEIVSKINLVDLAGSERARYNYNKDRLQEGANINKSLVTLGNCISALAENSMRLKPSNSVESLVSEDGDASPRNASTATTKKSAFIPYRNSILTWLLRDSLGGNAKTIMIATISPASSNYNETMSTLRYARRAKRIINNAIINEDRNVRLIRELRSEIDRLKTLLNCASLSSSQNSLVHDGAISKMLLENEQKVDQLTEAWVDKWREAARIMQECNVGIRRESVGVIVESELPHLIGMDDDLLSTGIILYHIKEGETKIGRSDAPNEQDIVLYGPGIEQEHAIVESRFGKVKLAPINGALCAVNGMDIRVSTPLTQGAVILLGKTNMFRFNHPAEAAKLREKRAPRRRNSITLRVPNNLTSLSDEVKRRCSLSLSHDGSLLLDNDAGADVAANEELKDSSFSALSSGVSPIMMFNPGLELERQQKIETDKLDHTRKRLKELQEKQRQAEEAHEEREKKMAEAYQEHQKMIQEQKDVLAKLNKDHEAAKIQAEKDLDEMRIKLLEEKVQGEIKIEKELKNLKEDLKKRAEVAAMDSPNFPPIVARNRGDSIVGISQLDADRKRLAQLELLQKQSEKKAEAALQRRIATYDRQQRAAKCLIEQEEKRLHEIESIPNFGDGLDSAGNDNDVFACEADDNSEVDGERAAVIGLGRVSPIGGRSDSDSSSCRGSNSRKNSNGSVSSKSSNGNMRGRSVNGRPTSRGAQQQQPNQTVPKDLRTSKSDSRRATVNDQRTSKQGNRTSKQDGRTTPKQENNRTFNRPASKTPHSRSKSASDALPKSRGASPLPRKPLKSASRSPSPAKQSSVFSRLYTPQKAKFDYLRSKRFPGGIDYDCSRERTKDQPPELIRRDLSRTENLPPINLESDRNSRAVSPRRKGYSGEYEVSAKSRTPKADLIRRPVSRSPQPPVSGTAAYPRSDLNHRPRSVSPRGPPKAAAAIPNHSIPGKAKMDAAETPKRGPNPSAPPHLSSNPSKPSDPGRSRERTKPKGKRDRSAPNSAPNRSLTPAAAAKKSKHKPKPRAASAPSSPSTRRKWDRPTKVPDLAKVDILFFARKTDKAEAFFVGLNLDQSIFPPRTSRPRSRTLPSEGTDGTGGQRPRTSTLGSDDPVPSDERPPAVGCSKSMEDMANAKTINPSPSAVSSDDYADSLDGSRSVGSDFELDSLDDEPISRCPKKPQSAITIASPVNPSIQSEPCVDIIDPSQLIEGTIDLAPTYVQSKTEEGLPDAMEGNDKPDKSLPSSMKGDGEKQVPQEPEEQQPTDSSPDECLKNTVEKPKSVDSKPDDKPETKTANQDCSSPREPDETNIRVTKSKDNRDQDPVQIVHDTFLEKTPLEKESIDEVVPESLKETKLTPESPKETKPTPESPKETLLIPDIPDDYPFIDRPDQHVIDQFLEHRPVLESTVRGNLDQIDVVVNQYLEPHPITPATAAPDQSNDVVNQYSETCSIEDKPDGLDQSDVVVEEEVEDDPLVDKPVIDSTDQIYDVKENPIECPDQVDGVNEKPVSDGPDQAVIDQYLEHHPVEPDDSTQVIPAKPSNPIIKPVQDSELEKDTSEPELTPTDDSTQMIPAKPSIAITKPVQDSELEKDTCTSQLELIPNDDSTCMIPVEPSNAITKPAEDSEFEKDPTPPGFTANQKDQPKPIQEPKPMQDSELEENTTQPKLTPNVKDNPCPNQEPESIQESELEKDPTPPELTSNEKEEASPIKKPEPSRVVLTAAIESPDSYTISAVQEIKSRPKYNPDDTKPSEEEGIQMQLTAQIESPDSWRITKAKEIKSRPEEVHPDKYEGVDASKQQLENKDQLESQDSCRVMKVKEIKSRPEAAHPDKDEDVDASKHQLERKDQLESPDSQRISEVREIKSRPEEAHLDKNEEEDMSKQQLDSNDQLESIDPWRINEVKEIKSRPVEVLPEKGVDAEFKSKDQLESPDPWRIAEVKEIKSRPEEAHSDKDEDLDGAKQQLEIKDLSSIDDGTFSQSSLDDVQELQPATEEVPKDDMLRVETKLDEAEEPKVALRTTKPTQDANRESGVVLTSSSGEEWSDTESSDGDSSGEYTLVRRIDGLPEPLEVLEEETSVPSEFSDETSFDAPKSPEKLAAELRQNMVPDGSDNGVFVSEPRPAFQVYSVDVVASDMDEVNKENTIIDDLRQLHQKLEDSISQSPDRIIKNAPIDIISPPKNDDDDGLDDATATELSNKKENNAQTDSLSPPPCQLLATSSEESLDYHSAEEDVTLYQTAVEDKSIYKPSYPVSLMNLSLEAQAHSTPVKSLDESKPELIDKMVDCLPRYSETAPDGEDKVNGSPSLDGDLDLPIESQEVAIDVPDFKSTFESLLDENASGEREDNKSAELDELARSSTDIIDDNTRIALELKQLQVDVSHMSSVIQKYVLLTTHIGSPNAYESSPSASSNHAIHLNFASPHPVPAAQLSPIPEEFYTRSTSSSPEPGRIPIPEDFHTRSTSSSPEQGRIHPLESGAGVSVIVNTGSQSESDEDHEEPPEHQQPKLEHSVGSFEEEEDALFIPSLASGIQPQSRAEIPPEFQQWQQAESVVVKEEHKPFLGKDFVATKAKMNLLLHVITGRSGDDTSSEGGSPPPRSISPKKDAVPERWSSSDNEDFGVNELCMSLPIHLASYTDEPIITKQAVMLEESPIKWPKSPNPEEEEEIDVIHMTSTLNHKLKQIIVLHPEEPNDSLESGTTPEGMFETWLTDRPVMEPPINRSAVMLEETPIKWKDLGGDEEDDIVTQTSQAAIADEEDDEVTNILSNDTMMSIGTNTSPQSSSPLLAGDRSMGDSAVMTVSSDVATNTSPQNLSPQLTTDQVTHYGAVMTNPSSFKPDNSPDQIMCDAAVMTIPSDFGTNTSPQSQSPLLTTNHVTSDAAVMTNLSSFIPDNSPDQIMCDGAVMTIPPSVGTNTSPQNLSPVLTTDQVTHDGGVMTNPSGFILDKPVDPIMFDAGVMTIPSDVATNTSPQNLSSVPDQVTHDAAVMTNPSGFILDYKPVDPIMCDAGVMTIPSDVGTNVSPQNLSPLLMTNRIFHDAGVMTSTSDPIMCDAGVMTIPSHDDDITSQENLSPLPTTDHVLRDAAVITNPSSSRQDDSLHQVMSDASVVTMPSHYDNNIISQQMLSPLLRTDRVLRDSADMTDPSSFRPDNSFDQVMHDAGVTTIPSHDDNKIASQQVVLPLLRTDRVLCDLADMTNPFRFRPDDSSSQVMYDADEMTIPSNDGNIIPQEMLSPLLMTDRILRDAAVMTNPFDPLDNRAILTITSDCSEDFFVEEELSLSMRSRSTQVTPTMELEELDAMDPILFQTHGSLVLEDSYDDDEDDSDSNQDFIEEKLRVHRSTSPIKLEHMHPADFNPKPRSPHRNRQAFLQELKRPGYYADSSSSNTEDDRIGVTEFDEDDQALLDTLQQRKQAMEEAARRAQEYANQFREKNQSESPSSDDSDLDSSIGDHDDVNEGDIDESDSEDTKAEVSQSSADVVEQPFCPKVTEIIHKEQRVTEEFAVNLANKLTKLESHANKLGKLESRVETVGKSQRNLAKPRPDKMREVSPSTSDVSDITVIERKQAKPAIKETPNLTSSPVQFISKPSSKTLPEDDKKLLPVISEGSPKRRQCLPTFSDISSFDSDYAEDEDFQALKASGERIDKVMQEFPSFEEEEDDYYPDTTEPELLALVDDEGDDDVRGDMTPTARHVPISAPAKISMDRYKNKKPGTETDIYVLDKSKYEDLDELRLQLSPLSPVKARWLADDELDGEDEGQRLRVAKPNQQNLSHSSGIFTNITTSSLESTRGSKDRDLDDIHSAYQDLLQAPDSNLDGRLSHEIPTNAGTQTEKAETESVASQPVSISTHDMSIETEITWTSPELESLRDDKEFVYSKIGNSMDRRDIAVELMEAQMMHGMGETDAFLRFLDSDQPVEEWFKQRRIIQEQQKNIIVSNVVKKQEVHVVVKKQEVTTNVSRKNHISQQKKMELLSKQQTTSSLSKTIHSHSVSPRVFKTSADLDLSPVRPCTQPVTLSPRRVKHTPSEYRKFLQNLRQGIVAATSTDTAEGKSHEDLQILLEESQMMRANSRAEIERAKMDLNYHASHNGFGGRRGSNDSSSARSRSSPTESQDTIPDNYMNGPKRLSAETEDAVDREIECLRAASAALSSSSSSLADNSYDNDESRQRSISANAGGDAWRLGVDDKNGRRVATCGDAGREISKHATPEETSLSQPSPPRRKSQQRSPGGSPVRTPLPISLQWAYNRYPYNKFRSNTSRPHSSSSTSPAASPSRSRTTTPRNDDGKNSNVSNLRRDSSKESAQSLSASSSRETSPVHASRKHALSRSSTYSHNSQESPKRYSSSLSNRETSPVQADRTESSGRPTPSQNFQGSPTRDLSALSSRSSKSSTYSQNSQESPKRSSSSPQSLRQRATSSQDSQESPKRYSSTSLNRDMSPVHNGGRTQSSRRRSTPSQDSQESPKRRSSTSLNREMSPVHESGSTQSSRRRSIPSQDSQESPKRHSSASSGGRSSSVDTSKNYQSPVTSPQMRRRSRTRSIERITPELAPLPETLANPSYSDIDYTGEQAVATLFTEMIQVGGFNPANSQHPKEYGGWRLQGQENGILLLQKSKEGTPIDSFMGISIIKAPASAVFNMICDVNNLQAFDTNLQDVEVLLDLPNRFKILHLVYTTDKCYLQKSRDVCVVVKDAKQLNKYVIAATSVQHRKCPDLDGVVRAHVMCCGIGLEPIKTPKGEEHCKVIYRSQVDLKGELQPKLTNVIMKKQPLCLENVKKIAESSRK